MRVSDQAYKVLAAQKESNESFSDVILRLAPFPIETCGDLLDVLATEKSPFFNPEFLKERRSRKRNPKRSTRKYDAH